MLIAFLFHLVVIIHRAQQMLDVVDESFAVCEATEEQGLAAVGTFGLALLDPSSKAVLTGKFAARWAHPWFLYVLKADIALEESEVPASLRILHRAIIYNELDVQIISFLCSVKQCTVQFICLSAFCSLLNDLQVFDQINPKHLIIHYKIQTDIMVALKLQELIIFTQFKTTQLVWKQYFCLSSKLFNLHNSIYYRQEIIYSLHVMKVSLRVFLIVILFLLSVTGYKIIKNKQSLFQHYKQNLQRVNILIYHNQHYSKSKYFQDLQQVIKQTQYRNKDYSSFAFLQCQHINVGVSNLCDDLMSKRENRRIVAFYPSSKFIRYGKMKMLEEGKHRIMDHKSQIFTPQDFQNFLDEVVPNYFEEMVSIQEYYDWLYPRYSPKVIFATREDQIPLVLKKINVYYYLRFDFGFVSDLTESITKVMNITTFPRLMVVQFNYQQNTYDIFNYKQNDFSDASYSKIKQFLSDKALPEPRNDLIFQKISIPKVKQIFSTKNKWQITERVDQAHIQVLISDVKGQPLRLKVLEQKYGRYFEYIHYDSENQKEIISYFDHQSKKTIVLKEDQVKFQGISGDKVLEAYPVLLSKNYIVIIFRQKYGYQCSLIQTPLFRESAQCLAVKQQDYQSVGKALQVEFDIGFVSYYNQTGEINSQLVGRTFKDDDFVQTYTDIENLVRIKVNDVVKQFSQNPISKVKGEKRFIDLCNTPNKKCAILFTLGDSKDRTSYDYLKQIAKKFINEYEFYEIDLTCNKHYFNEFSTLGINGGLIVFHPSQKSYIVLKAKLSQSTFEKFLKANLRDRKKLPLKPLVNLQIIAKSCHSQEQVEQLQEEDL